MREGASGVRVIQDFIRIVFFTLLIITQPGCWLAVGAAAGAGTVAYVSGDVEADLDATPDQVIEATKKAAGDLKLQTEYAHASAVDGRAELRSAADKKISIRVESRSPKTSHISIRVGTFGDDSLSNQVLTTIRDHLKSVDDTASSSPTGGPT
jgi:hypothetical protein